LDARFVSKVVLGGPEIGQNLTDDFGRVPSVLRGAGFMLFDICGLRCFKPYIATVRRLQDQRGVSIRDVSGANGDAVFKRLGEAPGDLEEKSC
jgi:hypothetical protein